MSKVIVNPKSLPSVFFIHSGCSDDKVIVELFGLTSIKVICNDNVWVKSVNLKLPIQLIFNRLNLELELIEVNSLDRPELLIDDITDDED